MEALSVDKTKTQVIKAKERREIIKVKDDLKNNQTNRKIQRK